MSSAAKRARASGGGSGYPKNLDGELRRLRELWIGLDYLDVIKRPNGGDGLTIKSILIRLTEASSGGYIVVIKGETPVEEVVAFVSGCTVAEAVQKTINAIRDGTLRWRQEHPYTPKSVPA